MTSAPIPTTEFHCAQCGGVLHPDEGQMFLACPYCNSTVYLDKSRVVFHWSLTCTVNPEAAAAGLRRWMAGNQTVKDLDRKSRMTATTFQYFPLWYIKTRADGPGREKIFTEPAAAISISEIKSLIIPAGDLQKYDPALDAQAAPPTVPFPTLLNWLAARGVKPEDVAEAALVHVPVYIFKYAFQGKTYTAMVEGASGKVFANLFPPKAEEVYLLAGCLSTAGFLVVSSFPVIGYFLGEELGVLAGLAACAVTGGLYALAMLGVAAWVSAKV